MKDQKMISYDAYINKQWRRMHGATKPVLTKAAFERVQRLQYMMNTLCRDKEKTQLIPMSKHLYEKVAKAYNRTLERARKLFPYIENFHKWFKPMPEKFEDSYHYQYYLNGLKCKEEDNG